MAPQNPFSQNDNFDISQAEIDFSIPTPQTPNTVSSKKTLSKNTESSSQDKPITNKSNIRSDSENITQKPPSTFARFGYAVINGILLGFIGAVIDFFINIIHGIVHIHGSGDMTWLMSIIMGALGGILGWLFASESGAISFKILAFWQTDEHEDVSISQDITKGIGLALFLGTLFWAMMVIAV